MTTRRSRARSAIGNVAVFGTLFGGWRSDGTAAGTIAIGDLSTTPFSRVGNSLHFTAGGEPYRTDGTTTHSLGDINGSGSSVTRATTYHDLAGMAYFAATDGSSGVELWRSDGTSSTRVADIHPGSPSSSPSSIVVLNGRLYFAADDGTNGRELWTSDGTPAGTTLVKNIHPSGSSAPSRLTVMGSLVYFFADDGTNGRELWRTDGTADGTVLVANAVAGSDGLAVDETTVVGNTLYFVTANELWKSNGTTVELVRGFSNGFTAGLADFIAPSDFSSSIVDSGLAALYDVGGKLVLFADDGIHGREPWVSDGTAAGTLLLGDIFPGADSSVAWTAATFGSMMFFAAQDPDHGIELWRTDGTAAGTLLAADVAPGAASSSPLVIPGLTGSDLMFLASTPSLGYQLYKYVLAIGATAVTATAISTTSVSVAWSMAADATSYDLYRNDVLLGSFSGLSTTVNGLTPATTYLFRVQPRANDALGPLSAPDLATTVMFTDDPIVARLTVVKRQHLAELLTAINAVRAAASLAPVALRDLAGATILASDVQSLRDALASARTALGFATAWTDPSLPSSVIRAVHVEELRGGVK